MKGQGVKSKKAIDNIPVAYCPLHFANYLSPTYVLLSLANVMLRLYRGTEDMHWMLIVPYAESVGIDALLV